MDLTSFRILDALSRRPGGQYSINGLVKWMRELGYTAYYKNVYDRVQDLWGEGVLEVEKMGNVSLVSLKLDNPGTLDELSVLELEKKKRFLKTHPGEGGLIQDIESSACNLSSAAILTPERNIKLSAAEILYLADAKEHEILLEQSKELSRKHNTKITPLLLTGTEFRDMLSSRVNNQAKHLLGDKIVLVNPSGFWKTITQAGMRDTKEKEPNSSGLDRGALIHSLTRFGYTGFTTKTPKKTRGVNIETLVTACLLRDDARLTEAALVLVMKNEVNYRLLLYLTLKHGKVNKAGYLLEAAKEITRNGDKKSELTGALKLFEIIREPAEVVEAANSAAQNWGIETRTTLHDLEETLRLYNAV